MKKLQITARDSLRCAAILCGAFLVCLLMAHLMDDHGLVATVLVLAVLLVSVSTEGYIYGVLASFIAVLADNFVFTFPYFSFAFLSFDSIIAAVMMLLVAVITSTLTTTIKIQQKMKAEAEKEKMRANLLRAVSHDLRTPLTTIYGACGLIRENYDELPKEQQIQLLGQVQEDTESLIKMVQNLLLITKANTDGIQLTKTETVLEELIDSTLVKFRKHYPRHPVNTVIPEEFVSLPMDPVLIQQVLLNLLENAVIHGQGMTELGLEVQVQSGRAIFRVLDDGCGIPAERMRQLFSGYSATEHQPADGRNTGMGIGLSVCATIVRAHGGEIWGENRKGGGTIISFSLAMEEQSDEQ